MSKREELLIFLKSRCLGRSRAMDSAAVARAVNLSRSGLQKCVNRLRRDGEPIGNCSRGIFYAVNAGEVVSTIRWLEAMVKALLAAIAGLERGLERFGQKL